ncbi:MAG: hypothetical protein IKZ44_00890 [Clostridia bacterium]|nr:hypothetical protein [Clostridia bacterium]
MSEKAFFHNALEADLLSGNKQKRRLDAALGRTMAKASAPVRTNTQSKGGMPRWLYIPAVAVLLILTFAIGSIVFSRGLRGERHQAGQPITDQTPVEVPIPIILSNSTEVRLLNELDNGALFDQVRTEELHLPAFDESDWSWLREARASVNDLSATASTIRWTIELRLRKGDHAENPFETLADVTRGLPLCFFHADSGLDTPDVGAQLVEFASPGEIRFGEDGDDWIVLIPEICAMPQVYDQFPAALPPTGEVTIQTTMQILDRAGEGTGDVAVQVTNDDGTTDEVSAALLGTIEHTFIFDAEVLLNVADPIHVDVPLSGEYILSIHENSGFHNERVDLSGVTLDAEIHYTVEGVVVILLIKDAGALSDVEQESLYLAISGGPGGTGDLPFAYAQKTDSNYRVYPLSRTFWGSARFARYLIAIDPSEYAAAKGVDFFGYVSYAAGEAGDEPREDWSWSAKDMEGGKLPEINYVSAPLAAFEIPLPEVDAAQTDAPIPKPTAPQDDKVAIYVYFYDGDANDAINERFKAQYPELYNAHRDPDHATAEQVQQAIEARRQVAAAYYEKENREKCLQLCSEEDVVFLSSYSAMCIIRVPYEKFSEIRSAPGVTHIEIYEEMTSTTSDTDPSPEIQWTFTPTSSPSSGETAPTPTPVP